MFIDYNEEDLQVPDMEITTDMATDYYKFMNKLMAEIYDLFFQERLPRVLPKMRQILQLANSKRIGDWFLTKFKTTIRLYGFLHQPYILPAFLTTRVFSLELIWKRLIVEEEHFLSYKKSSNLVFPWEVGPYTIRIRAALPLVTNLLRGMGFSLEQAVNYDPHQIISKRRKAHKCKPFEHTEILILKEAANRDDFPNLAPMVTSIE